MAGRVVVVATSPRLPPGVLSWPAWEALRGGTVLVGSADHPQLPFLARAGIAVSVSPREVVLVHERAVAGEEVVWLACSSADELFLRELAERAEATSAAPVVIIEGSTDPAGAKLLDVVAVMDRLRSPGGCPWDAAQTHDSLKPYLLEEAYEAYEAIESGDRQELREELGDVLLQVAFHARLAQESAEPWSIDDVAADLVDKLVRRHPHVFAEASADDLDANWEAAKQREKGRSSVTDGVPLAQPALALAAKLQKRAGRIGAPLQTYDGPGGELWELVARCRAQGVDPEAELRTVARTYRDRLAGLERDLLACGLDPHTLSPEEWQDRWN